MKKFTNKLIKTLPFLIIALLVGTTVVYAVPGGSKLSPSGNAITDQMYSLQDIYNLATNGTPADARTGDIAPTPGVLEDTGVTLTEVYDAVATAISQTGGVDLSNMWNGTSNTIDGGSQALGGIDDANYEETGIMTQTPPTDRYKTIWTTCNLGNNYCETGDTGANAKDEATGLIWSYPLKDIGGTSFDTETDTAVLTAGCVPDFNCAYWNTDTYYSWDNSHANNMNSETALTAQELCSQHTGWSLPHQKQLMQAYIDGAYGNLEPVGVGRSYWSATTVSGSTGGAWYVYLSSGFTSGSGKYNGSLLRCVR